MRANVYIDGFNFYYGCFGPKRPTWRAYRWVDVSRMVALLFPDLEVGRIRYFAARIDPTPDDPEKVQRQAVYLRALESIPNLTVHYGRFTTNKTHRLLADPDLRRPTPLEPPTKVAVIHKEEKGSDVNLATYLLVDAWKGEYEAAIVITNDSDLVEPIRILRDDFGREIVLVNPHEGLAKHLKACATRYESIRVHVLRDAQFPDVFEDAHGVIRKPATW